MAAGSTSESSRAFVALSSIMAVGLLGVVLHSSPAATLAEGLAQVAVGVAASTAAAVVGGLLGFLFAIPRTSQGEDSTRFQVEGAPRGDRVVDYHANTNLEQISDWLTKILVGVGLTQITTLPENLRQVSTFVARGLGEGPSAPAFAGSILVVFTICGFLQSYLWTRLYLPGEFRQADIKSLANQVSQVNQKVANLERQAERDAVAIGYAQRQLNPSTDAPPVPPEELSEAIRAASPAARALVFSQAQQLRKGSWKDQPTAMDRVIPIFKGLVEGDASGDEHRYFGQLGYALKDRSSPDWKGAEAAFDRAIALRGPWQKGWVLYEFNRALCKIARFPAADGTGARDDGLKESIVDDLAVATSGGLREMVLKEPVVARWMQSQGVTQGDLARKGTE